MSTRSGCVCARKARTGMRAPRHDPVRAAAESARLLTVLFKPGAIGSDKAPTRVQEMIDDLTARIAAMRVAVDAAVEQTEARVLPSAIESRLERSLFLDELLPMRRKARLWDLYRRSHGLLAGSTGDRTNGRADAPAGEGAGRASGVREIFNQAYTKAYEAEAARLRRRRQ